ncbi:MAG: acetylglutamate kinase, partial [Deltaproteobacteria bacterium]|nr:acetylglutamate kinase [Deltaproteobacteria bacterium]
MVEHTLIESLKTAMPYIRKYRGETFVVKIGGRILGDAAALSSFAHQIAFLQQLSIRVIVVHGGGPQASDFQRRLGMEPRMIAGRRITDEATLEVVKMVYGGLLNLNVLAALRANKVMAVGLSGLDANLVVTSRRAPMEVRLDDGSTDVIDYGHVGDVRAEQVDTRALRALCEAEIIPVVASLAADADGNVLNVNADTMASELAIALEAKKLVYLTDTIGLLRDKADPRTLVPFATPEDIDALTKQGAIDGGMGPKVRGCVRAATSGVKRTHIIHGLAED